MSAHTCRQMCDLNGCACMCKYYRGTQEFSLGGGGGFATADGGGGGLLVADTFTDEAACIHLCMI